MKSSYPSAKKLYQDLQRVAQAHLNFLLMKWHSTFFKSIIVYGPGPTFSKKVLAQGVKVIKLFELEVYKNLFRI